MATHIYKFINAESTGGGSGGASQYTQTFNAGASWGAASGGLYSIPVAAATHGAGTSPAVQVFELVLGNYEQVDVDTVSIDGSGNVEISVTENLDARFEGKIIIIGEA